jgi:dipeptidyl aminopeptidase/acylaminoacyl peptidase
MKTLALTMLCVFACGASAAAQKPKGDAKKPAAPAAESSPKITWEDYQRASSLRAKLQGLVINEAGPATWIDETAQFWYRRTVDGGHDFVLGDAKAATKKPAFDHEKLAASLSTAASKKFTAVTLPFNTFNFVDSQKAVAFSYEGSTWRCELSDYACKKTGTVGAGPGRGRGGVGPEPPSPPSPWDDNAEFLANPYEGENDVFDGVVYPQQGRGGFGGAGATPPTMKASPDGKWEALIRNYNVFVRPTAKNQPGEPPPVAGNDGAWPLSLDGSEGSYYTLQSINWSPDSTHLAAYRVRPGYHREVHYVRSSPDDQLQPKYESTGTLGAFARDYAKPGDTLDVAQPVLFDVAAKKEMVVDNRLFPNPFSISQPVWHKDSRGFTFDYNQRGHQAFRVIEVNAHTGEARALIDEQSSTFITYSRLAPAASGTGGYFRHDVNDGKEIVWLSERDGWAHLYLYDGITGRVKDQITRGEWVVRYVDKVDDEKRQIWFRANGMYPGKDPYFAFAYRINFDGTGLTPLTEGDGNHVMVYSSDYKYLVDTWSRVDAAPVTELRSAEDGKKIMDLESAGTARLEAAGWRAPEVFAAKGRDGKTDIWGVIFRPRQFDAGKKYPVIEAIYAGPQGSFVPKSFGAPGRGGANSEYAPNVQVLTELGFIVVQIDGMGTANRSRAFHDVSFKNLGDAGFPDRILWHKAVAAKYPYYDITRVGIFGTSAGGQNALGGLLFHPEFYKVGSANSGCHDNRMDKVWWNEQWMGWPIGPEYAASSNVDNAYRLKGKLQLVVPELDTNVDPSSTMQVVNALMKANKKFDLLVVPGGDHGAGGRFGQRLMFDFFVHNLLGIEPPEWQAPSAAEEAATERVPN